jgi:hypothetical protein
MGRHSSAGFGTLLLILPRLLLIPACAPVGESPDAPLSGFRVADSRDVLAVLAEALGADPFDVGAAVAAGEPLVTFTVTLDANEDYQLFRLGHGSADQRWSAYTDAGIARRVAPRLALFDEELNLLARSEPGVAGVSVLLRTATKAIYVGAAPPAGDRAQRTYPLHVRRTAETSAAAPQPQTVWLNFGGAAGVVVRGRESLSLPQFDARRIGSAYAGADERIRTAIADAVALQYAAYGVVVLDSDRDERPHEPHSVIHFGGNHPTLLGLADGVDPLNGRVAESAIVFTDRFAAYAASGLTPDELALAIGNVAAHELGHLLGLYHVRQPGHLMDIHVTLWDLTEPRSLGAGPLDPDVFPVGRTDPAARLAEAVGRSMFERSVDVPAPMSKAAERRVRCTGIEVGHIGLCGTCADVD